MNIKIDEINDSLICDTIRMITDLMNYHRKLNNAPKEYWSTDEQSRETLSKWIKQGEVYNIFLDDILVGFFYVRFGGQDVAWLEDLFILESYRSNGIGKCAMKRLDELMIDRGIVSMFVDVVPRNTSAIKLYKECGFDHLNIIQLRKNYDNRLNKEDDIELLGFNFKKY
ncbi:MAG: GNAT family N-acetyltransferase [Filifactoraceae bacterium]